jgi:hypothetical protein
MLVITGQRTIGRSIFVPAAVTFGGNISPGGNGTTLWSIFRDSSELLNPEQFGLLVVERISISDQYKHNIRSYIKNISKYKVQFSDHIYTHFLDFFHVDHRYKYQNEVWKKLRFITNYCSLDNDDPISFFMILLPTQIFVYKDFSSTLNT